VDTGALCVRAPVFTGRVGKKHYTTMPFANTARNVDTGAWYTLPVITGHHHAPPQHGPWTRVSFRTCRQPPWTRLVCINPNEDRTHHCRPASEDQDEIFKTET